MRVSRLYIDAPLSEGSQLELDEHNAHYVRTVLRLKKNAAIKVFNGTGGEWSALLLEVHKKSVLIKIGKWHAQDAESALNIHLGMVIVRSERMDWAIQKAVELGAMSITPLLSERCVVQIKAGKLLHKTSHWQRIIQHATEQCGRTRLPNLEQPAKLHDWLAKQVGTCIFFDPYAMDSMPGLPAPSASVTLLSGPEGGFSEAERLLIKQAGFIPVKLGNRILRAETAVLAAISAVQTLWGDFT